MPFILYIIPVELQNRLLHSMSTCFIDKKKSSRAIGTSWTRPMHRLFNHVDHCNPSRASKLGQSMTSRSISDQSENKFGLCFI